MTDRNPDDQDRCGFVQVKTDISGFEGTLSKPAGRAPLAFLSKIIGENIAFRPTV